MYPSDLTDAQWSKLEPLLKEPRGDRQAGGRPRKHPLRRIVDALLYVVKTGWRVAQVRKPTNEGAPHLDFEMWETTKASPVVGGWRRSESLTTEGAPGLACSVA